MREIRLTRGMVAFVDDEDYVWLSQWKWYPLPAKNRDGSTRTFYAILNDSKGVYMHVKIAQRSSFWIRGKTIDHRDGDGLNNQKSNLRSASISQNGANSKPRNGRRFKGTRQKPSGKWEAFLTANRQQSYLGTFATEEQAARAYDIRAKEEFGEFARLNFEDEQ